MGQPTQAVLGRAIHALELSEATNLADLASSDCPTMTGAYTLWERGGAFLYVGIARVDPSETTNLQAQGIRGRLNTYRRARLTSDFAMQLFLRFVVPSLDQPVRDQLLAGDLTAAAASGIVREHVALHISYRTWTSDPTTAAEVEAHVRREGLPESGQPMFNPL